MRKHFFNFVCLLFTLVIFKPHAKALPGINWEAILKPAEYLQGYSWGKQQGKGRGGDDDDNYSYNDDDDSNYNNDDDNYSSGDDDDHYNNDDDNYNGGGDDDDHYSNDDDDSSEIPLDGGLSFLAAAGAGLGIKKLRDNRAKKKAERDTEQ